MVVTNRHMTHEETIKRIQELVPSVMELEFGCVVETNIFPSYPCHFRLCYKTWKSDILVCENNEEGQALLSMSDCTILGKPITLAVVFQAIHATMCLRQQSYNKQETAKELVDYFATFEDDVYGPRWNLSKDNFNDQSEETKTFIGGLLNNK